VGSWGSGLYAGDFALDLRSTIRAVSRLPFEPDRLVEILTEFESSAALNPQSEDHTTFWLVVADQFARRGIASARAREAALRIIDSGQDVEMQRKLGQGEPGLRKRQRMLAELRDRLVAPPIAKKRETISKPQPYLMDVGDALVYPTCGGDCWNPYTTRPDQLRIHGPGGGQPWHQDGWGAMVIVERGRAFDFFAWYRPVVMRTGTVDKPDLETLSAGEWHLELPGTCSPIHFRRMQIEKVGSFPIDAAKVHHLFPGLRPGISAAASDITIANRMKVWPEPQRRLMLKTRDVRIAELF
jgi:hypothetical protein